VTKAHLSPTGRARSRGLEALLANPLLERFAQNLHLLVHPQTRWQGIVRQLGLMAREKPVPVDKVGLWGNVCPVCVVCLSLCGWGGVLFVCVCVCGQADAARKGQRGGGEVLPYIVLMHALYACVVYQQMREVYAAWREEMAEVPPGDRGELNRWVVG
jgi:hypothetical protein